MEKQFEKVKKLALKLREETLILNKLIESEYGFDYSDTDDDQIIDTLDYGTSVMSFEEFEQRMTEYKEDFDNERPFRVF